MSESDGDFDLVRGVGEDTEPGEMYLDVVQGRYRRRRGKRKIVRHGPYSAEESMAIEAWRKFLSAQRRVDGPVAQMTCRGIAVFLIRARLACEKYSFENYPDGGLPLDVVLEEIDITQPVPDDADIYENLRDDLT